MAVVEIPVEKIVGACAWAGFFLGIELAPAAVVAHLRNVGGRGRVGLGGHESPIRMERHAEHVRRHDPLMRVDIHFQKPVVGLLRIDAGEEQEVPEYHQPLDVVIVGRVDGFRDGEA